MRWGPSSRVAILVVALLAFAGCTPLRDDRVDLHESELVGAWATKQGRSLTFEADGGFVAVGLPHQLFEGFTTVLPPDFDPETDRLDGSGEWRLKAARSDRERPRNHVDLHLLKLFGRETSGGIDLRIEREGSDIVLAFYLGDPDLNSRVVYRRCTQPCAAASPVPTASG